MIDWEQLPNGKWRKKSKGVDEKKMKRVLKNKKVYCEDCLELYSLDDPCIHHLTDSPEHRQKYEEYKKRMKKKPEDKSSQQSLYDNSDDH